MYTFDDGLGNILFPTDNFSLAKDHFFLKKYLYRIFGNRYSTKKIKKTTKLHYTIYKNYKNSISDNCVFIGDIFNKYNLKKNFKEESCTIILGTILSEYFKGQDIFLIKEKFKSFINQLNGLIFIIPHPRSDDMYEYIKNKKNIIVIDSNKISEEIIFEIKSKYKIIDLYGFCSSSQFYFLNYENFNHHLIINEEKRVLEGWSKLVKSSKYSSIDLKKF